VQQGPDELHLTAATTGELAHRATQFVAQAQPRRVFSYAREGGSPAYAVQISVKLQIASHTQIQIKRLLLEYHSYAREGLGRMLL